MNTQRALIMFDALSQETRLQAFRLLVKAGDRGLAAGVMGEKLNIAHNTLSFHLTHLANAGIVSFRKEGRSVIYSANFAATRDLIGFMVKDCCSLEHVNIRENKKTGSSVIELASCCEPKRNSSSKSSSPKQPKRASTSAPQTASAPKTKAKQKPPSTPKRRAQ